MKYIFKCMRLRRFSVYLYNLNLAKVLELHINLLSLLFFSVWSSCGNHGRKQHHLKVRHLTLQRTVYKCSGPRWNSGPSWE